MLTLVIDIECETRDEFEDKSEEVQQIVEYVAGMVGKGYQSAYEPSFHIEDSEADPTMKYLRMMRTQMRNGYHLSDEDMNRIVDAVEEIENLRDEMLMQRKAK